MGSGSTPLLDFHSGDGDPRSHIPSPHPALKGGAIMAKEAAIEIEGQVDT